MKKINWIVRIKNKAFWVALIPALLLLVQAIAAVFGFAIDLGDLGDKLLTVRIVGELGNRLSFIVRHRTRR